MSNTFIVQFLKTYADHTHALANLIDHCSGTYVDADCPRNVSPTANILADAGYQVRTENTSPACQAGDVFGEARTLAAKINQMNNKFRGSSDDVVKQATDMLTGNASSSANGDDGYIEDIGLGEHHASSRIKRDCEMEIRAEYNDLMHIESVMSQLDLASMYAVSELDKIGLSPLKNPTEYKKRLMDAMMYHLADTLEDAREQVELTKAAQAKDKKDKEESQPVDSQPVDSQPVDSPPVDSQPEESPPEESDPEEPLTEESFTSGSLYEDTP